MTASLAELLAFFHDALLVSLLAGIYLSFAGLFLHLRRSLFLGAALPPIVGFGFVAAETAGLSPFPAGIVVLLVCTGILSWRPRSLRAGITEEAAIGIGYVGAMAGTVLILAMTTAEGHLSELLLKGNALSSTCRDVHLLAGLGLPLALVLVTLRRRFILISVAPDVAQTEGIGVKAWTWLLFFAISGLITLTLTAVGAMACFGLLLLPPLASLAVCGQVATLFWLTPVLGGVGAFLGIVAALAWDLPAGPAMILSLLSIWFLCRLAGYLGTGWTSRGSRGGQPD